MKQKLNFWIVLLIILTLLIIQGYLHDSSIERTIYFLILIVIVSYVVANFSSTKFNVTRFTRENRQQVGQYFKETYEISNEKLLPVLWVSVNDLSGINTEIEKRLLAWIPGNTKKIFVNQTILGMRGVFTLGPTEIVSGDPFGLFSRSVNFHSKEKLVVIPSYERLVSFPDPMSTLTGGAARKSRDTEVSPYSVSVREFQPGDPLRRIDWKSTARLDKLMVKEFEEDPQANVWIFLDGNIENHFSLPINNMDTRTQQAVFEKFERREFKLPDDTFEYAVSLAASICDYYINNDRSIGFGTNCQSIIDIAPERGTRQLDKVLEILASLRVSSGNRFPEFLISQGSLIQKGSSVILITPDTTPELMQAVEILKRRNNTMMLVCINSKGFGGRGIPDIFYDQATELNIKFMEINKNEKLSDKIFEIR